jgi:hypothetical protein
MRFAMVDYSWEVAKHPAFQTPRSGTRFRAKMAFSIIHPMEDFDSPWSDNLSPL